MTLIALDKIHRRFGDVDVLTGAGLRIEERDRVGIVGDNGAGKTTLIRILAGVDEADRGTRSPRRDLRIAYAEQIPRLEPGTDVRTFVRRGDGRFEALEQRIRDLERELAAHAGEARLLEEYGTLHGAFEAGGGYDHDHHCDRVLSGLGFSPADQDKDLGVLSGGEKSRAVLATLMTAPADLLILDEPTNHLDLDGIAFVESYVQRHPGAVVVVSHDRRFLDAVAQRIVVVEDGGTASFKGNYSAYVSQRDQQLLAEARAFKNQQAYVDKELEYIRRNMAGRMSRQAKGRLKRLQRLERISAPKRGKRAMRLSFTGEVRGQRGQTMLEAEELTLRIAGRTLVDRQSFRIEHGETVGLVGRNGTGKTTLLDTLSGLRAPDGGRVIQAHGLRIGTFRQEVTHLPQQLTVLEALRVLDPTATDKELRDHLGLFLFSGDDVEVRVADLSGGEKQRLGLARLTRSDHDMLCLDEPTNHLDIGSCEGLEQALREFPGTVLLISHDRELLDAVADRILYLEDGRVRTFTGGLAACMAQIAAERAERRATEAAAKARAKAIAPAAARAPSAEASAKIRNPLMFQKLEDEIMALEEERDALRADMTRAENYLDAARMKAMQERERGLEARLADAYQRWENW